MPPGFISYTLFYLSIMCQQWSYIYPLNSPPFFSHSYSLNSAPNFFSSPTINTNYSITFSFRFITTNSMKSFMFQQAGTSADDKPADMPNTLMLLSRSTNGRNARMFECKTCNRQFPSFQALGGHRASHRKPRHARCEEAQTPEEPTKPRVHECSICGLEFSLGQALGGHMRRHRANGEGANVKQERKRAGSGLSLDLNLAPPEADGDCHETEGIDLELHLDLEEKVRFVQWLH